MKLSYIFHSGFVLETEQSILLFDYWMDPSGVMDGVLRSEKPMYVFSSHFHEDHFTKEIFEWKKQRKDITYILSKDIYKHRRANKEDANVWLAKGGTWIWLTHIFYGLIFCITIIGIPIAAFSN